MLIDPFFDMSPSVQTALSGLTEAAKTCFKDDLSSIVLFGSGAEGRLRATSDINLLILLKQFRQEEADGLRDPLRLARAAARAVAMFILEEELPSAVELFAVKFSDIARRHRVLFGELPAALRAIPPADKKRQLREMLMNLVLRLRLSYTSLREDMLAEIVAGTAGPLRSAASTLLDLEGQPVGSPRESLETVVRSLDGGQWSEVLTHITAARESA
ncbi:MAG: nucleotidyltransferase domain-containing protein, partial [Azoarcus sp.]|nr:nucleotidyltransferase domain-containing protein [Azoarcus sp.]